MNRDRRADSHLSRSYRSGAAGLSPGGNNKTASPQTIAALSVGAIAALGFAGWTISNALAPSTPPASAPGSVPVSASKSAAPAPGTTTVPPVISAPAASTAAVSTPARVGASPGSASRLTAASEAMLAPAADPFMALPPRPDKQAGPTNAVAQTPPNAAVIRNAPPTMAILPNFPGAQSGAPGYNASVQAMPVPPPHATVEIELVGTLMGNRPCAVFRTDQKMVTVPVDGAVAGWKVLRVRHGEAVVTSAGRTLRLDVGMSAAAGMVRRTQELPRDSFRAEPHSEVTPPPLVRNAADTSARRAADALADGPAVAASAGAMPLQAEDPAASQDALPPLPDTPLDETGRPKAPPIARFASRPERPFLIPAGRHALASDTGRELAFSRPATVAAPLPADGSEPSQDPVVGRATPAAPAVHTMKHRHYRRRRHRHFHGSHRFAARFHRQRAAFHHAAPVKGRDGSIASAFINPTG